MSIIGNKKAVSSSAFSGTAAALLSTYVAGTAQPAGYRRVGLYVFVSKATAGSSMTAATVKIEALDAAGNAYPVNSVIDADPDLSNAAVEHAITAPSAGEVARKVIYADLPPNAGFKVSAKLNAQGVAHATVSDVVTVTALAYSA